MTEDLVSVINNDTYLNYNYTKIYNTMANTTATLLEIYKYNKQQKNNATADTNSTDSSSSTDASSDSSSSTDGNSDATSTGYV